MLIRFITPGRFAELFVADAIHVNPVVIVVAMMIPLACLLFWPRNDENEEYNRAMSIFFILACINFIVYFLALEIKLFERMTFYLMIYNTILITNVVQGIRSKDMHMIAKIVCIILPLIQFILATPGGSLGIDNYRFFWE